MSTDTNQVSEDELSKDYIDAALVIMARHGLFIKPKETEQFFNGVRHTQAYKECYEALQSLIRTEKLKLLAEVRERVIGEDELLEPWNGDTPEAFERNTYTLKRNRLRTEQNAELTKLEAEL